MKEQQSECNADHLGTPRAITRPSDNAVVWKNDNTEPFGNSQPDENPSGLGQFAYNLRFPGQYFDQETGTNYNYARDYDPSIGRYIESDPVGLIGGINTYAFVGGNPLAITDRLGLAEDRQCKTCEKSIELAERIQRCLQMTIPKYSDISPQFRFEDMGESGSAYTERRGVRPTITLNTSLYGPGKVSIMTLSYMAQTIAHEELHCKQSTMAFWRDSRFRMSWPIVGYFHKKLDEEADADVSANWKALETCIGFK